MKVKELFDMAEDSQKIFITVNGNRYSGVWYEPKILQLFMDYFHNTVDVTIKTPEKIVATIRRY